MSHTLDLHPATTGFDPTAPPVPSWSQRTGPSPTAMTTTTGAIAIALPDMEQPPVADNRASYLSWGLAWLIGHGAMAISSGTAPLVSVPALLPVALLGTGVVTATVVTVTGIVRAQRGVTGPAKTAGTLLGAGWVIGFTALFLLITALSATAAESHLQSLLWPTGTGLVVGLMYLWGGTLQRDLLQYALGGGWH